MSSHERGRRTSDRRPSGASISRRSARASSSQPTQLALPMAPHILQEMEDSCAVVDSDEETEENDAGDNEVDVAARYGRRVSQLRDRTESLSLRRNSASMGQASTSIHPRVGSLTQRRPSTLKVPDQEDVQEVEPEAIATGATQHAYPPPTLTMPPPLERVVTADSLKFAESPPTTQPPSPEAEHPQALSEDENDLGQGTILSLRGALILASTCTAQMLDNISMTGVNIALPKISAELNIAEGQEQWLISGYTITFGGFLLLSGMLADKYGRKKVFIWGNIWLAMWTLIDGFAQTKIQLIIFRAFQGLGAASTVPSAIGIISNYFKGADRYRALTIFGSFGAIGFVMGLVLGGIFSQSLGWRYIFYITAPIGILVAVLGVGVIPKDVVIKGPKPALDIAGSVLGSASMVLLVFVLSSGGEYGWSKPFIIALLILSFVVLGLFMLTEWKVRNPIMPVYLWKQPNFAAVWLTGFIVYGWWQSIVYYICLYAQKVSLLSPMATAGRFAVMCPISIVTCISIGLAIDRYPPKAILFGGLLGCIVTPIPAAVMDADTSFWASVFPVAVIGVAAISIVYNVVSILMLAAVPPAAKSLAGGLCNTGFQIGSGVGLAINAAVNSAVFKKWEDQDSRPALIDAYGASMWTCTGLAGAAMLLSLFCIRNVKPMSAGPVAH